MAHAAPRRPTDGVDYVIGVVGGLTGIIFLVTLYCELTGQFALGWALLLLVLVVATALLIRHRRRVVRDAIAAQTADDAG